MKINYVQFTTTKRIKQDYIKFAKNFDSCARYSEKDVRKNQTGNAVRTKGKRKKLKFNLSLSWLLDSEQVNSVKRFQEEANSLDEIFI